VTLEILPQFGASVTDSSSLGDFKQLCSKLGNFKKLHSNLGNIQLL